MYFASLIALHEKISLQTFYKTSPLNHKMLVVHIKKRYVTVTKKVVYVHFFQHVTEDVDDKSNELTFQLETADGQIFEASYYRVYEYDEEKGNYVDSVDSNIKFDGANSYESTKIDVDDLTEEDLKGSKLILIHKVTEEVIFIHFIFRLLPIYYIIADIAKRQLIF